MVKVINSANIKDLRLSQGRTDTVKIFRGDMKQNLTGVGAELHKDLGTLTMKNASYEGSEGHAKLWNEIEGLKKKFNAAQAPTTAEIEALVGKVFIDITRRAQEAGDLTSLFATELTDLNATEVVTMKNIYKYRGKMQIISGANDSVPLIEQNFGATDTMELFIRAVGWKDSLANMLYNKLHTMEKVNQAAVDTDTDTRNAAIIGTIVGATYVASQKQAADTVGSTFDTKMYNTLRKAIKKLRGLKDPQTDRKIAVPSISILCNSADTWDIERVIRGQLAGPNGTLAAINAQALPIANIIEYDRGINDGFAWGKDTLSYPGVTAGKCYVFVPREYLFVMNKRPLTLETGRGSTLELSTEERAWYRVFGTYFKDFLGSSFAGTGLGAGFGAIIEVTLPTDS